MTLTLLPEKFVADVDARLDRLEETLPAIPAKVLHLQRAAARTWMERSDEFWSSVGDTAKDVFEQVRNSTRTVTGQARAASVDVVGTARSRSASLADEARDAVADVTGRARRGARTVRGQAAAQGRRVASVADEAAEDALDSAIDAVEGDTPGTGRPYESWTKAELLERAKELDIEGRYQMNKARLIKALRAA